MFRASFTAAGVSYVERVQGINEFKHYRGRIVSRFHGGAFGWSAVDKGGDRDRGQRLVGEVYLVFTWVWGSHVILATNVVVANPA